MRSGVYETGVFGKPVDIYTEALPHQTLHDLSVSSRWDYNPSGNISAVWSYLCSIDVTTLGPDEGVSLLNNQKPLVS